MDSNLLKPLVLGRFINSNYLQMWISLKYKKFPRFCFRCGQISHGAKECFNTKDSNISGEEDPQFGPWLRVSSRSDREVKDSNNFSGENRSTNGSKQLLKLKLATWNTNSQSGSEGGDGNAGGSKVSTSRKKGGSLVVKDNVLHCSNYLNFYFSNKSSIILKYYLDRIKLDRAFTEHGKWADLMVN